MDMGQKKTVTEATAVPASMNTLNVVDNIATGGEVAKMADAYGYSVKEYNGIQNNIVKDLEKIQQQQIDDAEVGYYNNAMQYINQIQTDNTLNRIALQKLASPGARGEEDNKKTQAIMAYDFDGAIPPTYESYLLKPVTTGAVMSNQTVLFNTNGYGSVYAGQLTSPQYIRNPIQRTATSLPVKTQEILPTNDIPQETTVPIDNGEKGIAEQPLKTVMENIVSAQ